ncbi:MAG: transcriptional regulator, LacI family [Clostridia bacterium]|nr:transcriptional regulator, LacI family [Clostridia bacterium]
MASIKDVAKAAGVSVTTVSRTINNNPSISIETREKVLKAIKDLNYSPNSMAKGLSSNNSYTITLLVNVEDEKSFYNPFFYEVMHGIEKVVYEREYCLIVANLSTMLKKENVLDWLIKGKRTEGVILPSSIIDSRMVKGLRNNNIPFVSLGEPTSLRETINWVDINNRKAGEQAVYYLLDDNRKRVAFIGYDSSKVFSIRRLEGYKAALENSKINFDAGLIIEGRNSKEDGYRMMKALLNKNDIPDSVVCADNLISIGAIRAIQDSGLLIPQDISVISFDNSQIAELIYPSVSTINVDVFELGVQSAKMLFELIEKPGTRDQELLISTNVEERETTIRNNQQHEV